MTEDTDNNEHLGWSFWDKFWDRFTSSRKHHYNQITGEYEENPDEYKIDHDYQGY
jgi:hypothetical protein